MGLIDSETENIKLITDTRELEGTCYIEFAPGGYERKHWQKNFVYLEQGVFLLFEPIFVKIVPCFDWYGVNEISRSNWLLIIEELKQLKETLKQASDFSDIRGKIRLSKSFETLLFERSEECRKSVIKLITDLSKWLKIQLKTYETVSVLGI
jgi:hypothetical protein